MSFAKVPGIPKGWNLLRVGVPELGEVFLSYEGPKKATEEDILWIRDNHPVPIMHFVDAWKAGHRFMQFPQEARFRDGMNKAWTYGTVVAYQRRRYKWLDSQGRWWPVCEVKDVVAAPDRGSEVPPSE